MQYIKVTEKGIENNCTMCEVYQDNTDMPCCPDHVEELEAALAIQNEAGEFDEWEELDKYFAHNYGDMLDQQLDRDVDRSEQFNY